MKRKIGLLLALLALFAGLLSGCEGKALAAAYSAGIEWLGDAPVTLELRLCGERSFGDDHYTGDYQADYRAHTGHEVLFGGTSLEERDAVQVSCTLSGGEGEARLCFQSRDGDAQVLCAAGERYEGELPLPAGSNYLYLETRDYTGSAQVRVE